MERNDVVMILTDIEQSNFGEMDIMIEERFGFEFDDDDLVLDNFRSIEKIADYVLLKVEQ